MEVRRRNVGGDVRGGAVAGTNPDKSNEGMNTNTTTTSTTTTASKDNAQDISHWEIITPVKFSIYSAMFISMMSCVFSVAAVTSLAQLMATSIEAHAVQWRWFASAVCFVVLGYLSRGLSFRVSHLAAFELETILREQLAAHVACMSLGTIGSIGPVSLVKVLQEDVRNLHVFVADSTPLYARAYASPVLAFLVLILVEWRLALVSVGVLVGGMVFLSIAMRGSGEASEAMNKSKEQIMQSVVEFVQAMPVVRTFDGGRMSFGRYEQALTWYRDIVVQWYKDCGPASRTSLIVLHPLPTIVCLMWAGLYWWWQEKLEYSRWLAVLLLGTGMAESLMPYMSLYHLLEQAKRSVKRIYDIQHTAPLPQVPPAEAQQPQDASVQFEGVCFRYEERESDALHDISFTAPSGSFTALVGPSGAGKSTVARLIPRFWDVTAGCVKVGGVDVRHMSADVLMQQIAFVFQDNFLFTGTIEENITLGLPAVHTAEQRQERERAVVAAAQAAQAHGFITELPDGYKTRVGERGASLSGGQRQRITIARAILQNRPILVLDEATAFADAENEALFMKALAHLMKGKTVFMIAHRLATIQRADQILFFEAGRLVESGTPQQLLEKKGAYAGLWDSYQRAQSWKLCEKK